uniref:helix-turn-helix transcriptional regulator n=1 Tax=Eubacterium cellulosolvens TaxID=29322 RepID=UPI0004835B0E|nr:WYL domain-containing protein [[Eubacterium] cellulosolvens]
MTGGSFQKIKLLKIVELLKQESCKEEPLCTNDIIQKAADMGISVDRRTLSKEIEFLNEQGYDIKSAIVGHQRGYYFENRDFSVPELKILIDAVQAANFITEEQTNKFIEKIATLGGSRRAEILRENVVCFNTTKHTNDEIYKNVAELEKALIQRKQASFYYFDRNEDGEKVYRKDKKRYVVEPMALIFSEDNYYLMAWSSKYEGKTNYRVDRMDTVAVEEEPVSEKAILETEDIATFRQQAFRMYGGETEDVVLEFNEKLIGVIHDKFGENTKMIRTAQGKCVASVRVQVSPTFWGWLFQFVGDMRIISPDPLIEEYRVRAKKATEI